ncbi:hypothetical protein [Paractinoplanes atraurantiacus]|uniref:hypothetical protein n=1 Tax=Paractinoplanes atraurantiacus TaxID=1036182 RepID=UPI000BE29DE8|nr:hypothetical protein [Actinoplanes atraurantiacus]
MWIDVTAELPVTTYLAGGQPDRARVAGVDCGIIHPFAVATRDGQALLVSGRAIRAEHRLHLADTKARNRATAARAPSKGQRGSRRWRKTRRRARLIEGRHRRRVEPGDTCPVSARHGVTPAAAHERRRREGQLAGRGPPHPER